MPPFVKRRGPARPGSIPDVLGMFTSITRISEIETRARKGAFRELNLADVAGEVVELYDAAAEQVATRLSLAGDREVKVTFGGHKGIKGLAQCGAQGRQVEVLDGPGTVCISMVERTLRTLETQVAQHIGPLDTGG